MSWTWQLEKEDGTIVTARDLVKETFISQGDAESWLGEHYPGLLRPAWIRSGCWRTAGSNTAP